MTCESLEEPKVSASPALRIRGSILRYSTKCRVVVPQERVGVWLMALRNSKPPDASLAWRCVG